MYRQNPVMAGKDSVEGLLRRKRILPQSQLIYQQSVDGFHIAYRITAATPVAELDTKA